MWTFVLDKNLQLLPIGIVGELYLGGVGVASGYLNRDELTAARFVDPPPKLKISNQLFWQGHKLYRTGDLVKWRRDKSLDYLGRVDHQVKLRGYRIELGEIEGILVNHPSVIAAAAVVREDLPGQLQLVAYITATEIISEKAVCNYKNIFFSMTHLKL